jgi:hypothetical protein
VTDARSAAVDGVDFAPPEHLRRGTERLSSWRAGRETPDAIGAERLQALGRNKTVQGADPGALGPLPAAAQRPRLDGGMSIRVFLADDQDLVRAGLAMIVTSQDDLEVVGEAGESGLLRPGR